MDHPSQNCGSPNWLFYKLTVYKNSAVESATLLLSVFLFIHHFDRKIIDTLSKELYNFYIIRI